jgi:hypothetical protein
VSFPTTSAIGPGPAVSASAPLPLPVGAADIRGWNWRRAALGVYLLVAAGLLLRLSIGTIRARHLTAAACTTPITVRLFRPASYCRRTPARGRPRNSLPC